MKRAPSQRRLFFRTLKYCRTSRNCSYFPTIQHLRYSRILSAQDLVDFYENYDFAVLCTTRLALEESEMNDEERAAVEAADARLHQTFTPETLARYANYFSEMPIRTWWG